MTVKTQPDTDKDSRPTGLPWPDGQEAQRLLARRVELCSQRRQRAWDLLVGVCACRCGKIQPRISFLELTGLGAQNPKDLLELARHAMSLPPSQTCSRCGARVAPEQTNMRLLFTYSHALRSDLVTIWDGQNVTWFIWSHQDGSTRALDDFTKDGNEGRSSQEHTMEPFLTASSFRLALGQIDFNRPKQPPALRSCLRRNPDFLPAVELTAQIRLIQGNYTSAAALLRRVVRQQPNRVDAWYALGISLMEMARTARPDDRPKLAEQAGRCLLQAQERSSSPKAAHYRALGSLLLMAGQEQAALDQLETALSLEPGHSETILHLGMAQLRCGRAKRALALLERAAADMQRDTVAALWLADCLIELGMLERAQAQLQICRRLGAPAGRIEAIEERMALRGTKA